MHTFTLLWQDQPANQLPPLPIVHASLTAQILQGNTFFIYSQTFLKKNVHSKVSHEDTEFSIKFSSLLGKRDLN